MNSWRQLLPKSLSQKCLSVNEFKNEAQENRLKRPLPRRKQSRLSNHSPWRRCLLSVRSWARPGRMRWKFSDSQILTRLLWMRAMIVLAAYLPSNIVLALTWMVWRTLQIEECSGHLTLSAQTYHQLEAKIAREMEGAKVAMDSVQTANAQFWNRLEATNISTKSVQLGPLTTTMEIRFKRRVSSRTR